MTFIFQKYYKLLIEELLFLTMEKITFGIMFSLLHQHFDNFIWQTQIYQLFCTTIINLTCIFRMELKYNQLADKQLLF